MNSRNIPLDYANDLLYGLQKAFWDERGRGARFRLTTVGRHYFVERCLPLIQSSEPARILDALGDFLQREEIAEKVAFDLQDRLLRVRIEGCIHRPIQASMAEQGIEPLTCVAANAIALALEERMGRPVELADIRTEEGICELLLVLFEKRPALD